MNYYIADCHFGHSGILTHDQRPFENVGQMERVMVANWNAVVRPKDTVYILGDFCWGDAEAWFGLLKRLNGKKVLVKGNHDLTEYPEELKAKFEKICDYEEIHDDGRRVILSHYPILFYKRSHNPKYVMLCGHVHVSKENDYLEQFIRAMKTPATEEDVDAHSHNCAQIYNVGAMMPWMDYTPRTLDEIIRRRAEWEAEQARFKQEYV